MIHLLLVFVLTTAQSLYSMTHFVQGFDELVSSEPARRQQQEFLSDARYSFANRETADALLDLLGLKSDLPHMPKPIPLLTVKRFADGIQSDAHKERVKQWAEHVGPLSENCGWDVDERAWIIIKLLASFMNDENVLQEARQYLVANALFQPLNKPVLASLLIALIHNLSDAASKDNLALDFMRKRFRNGHGAHVFEGIAIGSMVRFAVDIARTDVVQSFFTLFNEASSRDVNQFLFGFALSLIGDDRWEEQALLLMDKAIEQAQDPFMWLDMWFNSQCPLHDKFVQYAENAILRAAEPIFAADRLTRFSMDHRFNAHSEDERIQQILLDKVFEIYSGVQNPFNNGHFNNSFSQFLRNFPVALERFMAALTEKPAMQRLGLIVLIDAKYLESFDPTIQRALVKWFMQTFEPDDQLPSLEQWNNNLVPAWGVMQGHHISGQWTPHKGHLVDDEIFNEASAKTLDELTRQFAWMTRLNSLDFASRQKKYVAMISLIASKPDSTGHVARAAIAALNTLPAAPHALPHHSLNPGFDDPHASIRKVMVTAFMRAFANLTTVEKRKVLVDLVSHHRINARQSLRDFLKRNFHYLLHDFSSVQKQCAAQEVGCDALVSELLDLMEKLRKLGEPQNIQIDGAFAPHSATAIREAAEHLLEICERLGIVTTEFFRAEPFGGRSKGEWKQIINERFGDVDKLFALFADYSGAPEEEARAVVEGAVRNLHLILQANIDMRSHEMENADQFRGKGLFISPLHVLAVLIKYIDSLEESVQKGYLITVVEVLSCEAATGCSDGLITQLINTFYKHMTGSRQNSERTFSDYAQQVIGNTKTMFTFIMNRLEDFTSNYFVTEPFAITEDVRSALDHKKCPNLERCLSTLNNHSDKLLEMFHSETEFVKQSVEKSLNDEKMSHAETECVEEFKNYLFYPLLRSAWQDIFSDMVSYDSFANAKDKLVVPLTIDEMFNAL